MNDSEEDDDAPIIFRRPNSLLKQGHSTSSLKKTTAQKDSSSIFHQFVQNDSSSHKQNATSLPKASSEKPMAGSNIGSLLPAQSTNSSHDKLTTNDRRPKHEDELSDSDDDKPLSHRHNSVSAIVQRKCSVDSEKTHIHSSHLIVEGRSTEKMDLVDNPTIKSENSDDDKPLSFKYSGVINRSAFSHAAEAPQKSKPSSLKSMKLTSNTSEETDDSEDEKPLLSLMLLGISSKTTAPKGGEKRPLSDANPAESSLSKKAKLTGTSVSAKVKQEVSVSKESKEDDNDHTPIAQQMKKSPSSNSASINQNTLLKTASSSFKKSNLTMNKKRDSKFSKSLKAPVGSGGEQKWTTLQHNGVIFPPLYKPHGIKMLYKGQPVDLTPEQEEVVTMFAVMKDTDYALKKQFIKNFMDDWRLILGKNHIIKKFEDCDFTPIYEWHLKEKEKKKQMTSEEKKAAKEEKLKQEEKYMWAIVDGVKEKVGNFRVEPPGLFRGRGEHPKMGKLKKRIRPTDITINIGKDVPIPKCPIPGERWKEVKHDNTVTWLAFWNDPINPKEFKYVFLAASSSLKGQSDKEKYEKSRLLKDYIQDIRANYTRDFNSKDPTKRQISVATYLIDKLALRAGNEKDDDEADIVGCCTLKVENVELVPPNKLKFDFLGKDSIRYLNTVEVEPPVYTAIGDFRTAKKSNGSKKDKVDDLFDLLDTSKLNAHLKELMPGLTAKVFRTYNASITLDVILNKETRDGSVPEKVAVYQHANKEVAIICNHQRSVSKSHETQMSKLNEKINDLKTQREELTTDLSRAKLRKPPLEDKDVKPKKNLAPQAIENKIAQLDAKIEKMEMDKQIKEDLKTVALGTSKINYLDPRISVAWCKRHEVPIEKVPDPSIFLLQLIFARCLCQNCLFEYISNPAAVASISYPWFFQIFNKSLLAKFAWAMDVDPNFRF
ncbi:hypothetical protein ZIOFF_001453 [Zingiber officinale]|uniref:DNA topoisomerase I n=1 Tax=Zingiber officinale TaxID=94328 RepID=A0A8J5LS40_ZINOF|nr:hypothetical protein ZIOFF_001453 [Zingiber officinale]